MERCKCGMDEKIDYGRIFTLLFFYLEGIARQLWHHVADLLMLIKWTLSGGKLLQCTSPSAGTELPTVLCSLFT